MASNYFKVFGETIANNNILSDSDYTTNSERSDGFQVNTVIHSSVMNTVLRQCSLITLAIIDVMNDSGYITKDVGPNSNYDDIKIMYEKFINNYSKVNLGLSSTNYGVGIWNGNQFTTKTAPDSTDSYFLGTNKNNSNIEFIKWSSLEVSSAGSANKVTQYIGDKLITAIFESNGTTVKNATNATNTDYLNNFLNESIVGNSMVKFSFGPVGSKTTFEHTVDNVTLSRYTGNIAGGNNYSLVYQTSEDVTAFTESPVSKAYSSGNAMLVYNNSTGYGFIDNDYITIGISKSLNVSNKSIGSIPYKDIYGEFNYINPPSNDKDNDYILISKLNVTEEGGMIPEWIKHQKITVVENEDDTVDVTITNI